MKVSAALMLVSLIAGTGMAQERTVSIEGVVVDTVSRGPVNKAQVILESHNNIPQRPSPTGPMQPPQPKAAVTDASGAFAFRNLPPGSYTVVVHHPRYPMSRMGPVRQTVLIGDGQETKRLTVDLQPGATISGRVLDDDGDPVIGCFISVVSPKDEMRGGRAFQMEPSNENGEYRVWGIAAGKFLIAAQCPRPLLQPRPLSSGPPHPPSIAYPTQFYPLASEVKAAQLVDLSAGSEKSAIDFVMKPQRVYSISGSLTSTGGDWRSRNDLTLHLVPREKGPNISMGGQRQRIDRAQGIFELQSVFPGSYHIVAFTRNEAETRLGLRQAVEVVDRPLQINLELRPAVDLSGVIEVDGERKFPLAQVGMQLVPADQAFGLPPPPPSRIQEDGSFLVKGLLPSTWRIQVWAPNAFMKSLWVEGRELPERMLDTSAGTSGPLRIVLSTKTATIRGTAPPGQTLQIVGASEDAQFAPRWGTVANERGEFVLGGLAPGKYRVLPGDPGGAPSTEGGQEVTVAEGETTSLDVKPQPVR